MAALTWILTLICVAGAHLSATSPVLRSALVVQTGQNVSLSCNLTSSSDITWYLLRSDKLLPLLTVTSSTFAGEEDTAEFHSADSRIRTAGSVEDGTVRLEILQVEEEDAGLYFCTGRRACVNRGIRLVVDGADREPLRQPCWSLGICVLPAFLALCVVIIVGLYLCSGKPAFCRGNSSRRNMSLKVTEEESLHYSSLNLADMPHPSGRRGTRLVKEEVTYSTVASHKNPNGSRDHR